MAIKATFIENEKFYFSMKAWKLNIGILNRITFRSQIAISWKLACYNFKFVCSW